MVQLLCLMIMEQWNNQKYNGKMLISEQINIANHGGIQDINILIQKLLLLHITRMVVLLGGELLTNVNAQTNRKRKFFFRY